MAWIPDQKRLARLAKLLNAERNPYYVRHPIPPGLRRNFPTEGWYWVPAGAVLAQFLARDVFDAYHRLMSELEEAQDPTEEPA